TILLPKFIDQGTVTPVVGVIAPSLIAAAKVIIFIVEPGSYGLVKEREVQVSDPVAPGWFESTVGYSATARILPVSTSITIAVAHSAPAAIAPAASDSWAYHCRSA